MFTPGLEQLLHTIRPGARPAGRATFPYNLPEGAARRSGTEAAHEWLRRCVDTHFEGSTAAVAVEANLALFLVVRWENQQVAYANLQALWCELPLDKFVSSTGSAHRYLRLDYDLGALGPLLKEPQPHVHVEADGEPRFPVPTAIGNDVVGWFLDFVYRNFFYEDWIFWVEALWDGFCLERGRPNHWQRLVQVFDQSAVGILDADAQLQQDLRDLKIQVLQARRTIFPLVIPNARSLLFAHDL
jgi:hypothetical protein